jgi:hypothetical protein
MAEDEETATARYIAGNISTQLMLKTLFEIISTMADDRGLGHGDSFLGAAGRHAPCGRA